MERDELAAWLHLTLAPGVGNSTARRLLARFGPPQEILRQPLSALRECVTQAQAQALCAPPPKWQAQWKTSCAWLRGTDAQGSARTIITLGDARYPQALLDTQDPPLLLYLMGPQRLLAQRPFPVERCLAVVGSRNPTPQGAENARLFSRALHGAGLSIVSGLALGVDAAAHEGALDAAIDGADFAATIAVLGSGLDHVYPRKNLGLAQRIAARGLLVSEYPLGTPPLAVNFPKRNRIISGLCQGTLVVEAAAASGSLITARLAAEQGREVFAIPGSIHAPQSRGCHALIRQGAKLVESAQDVLEELRIPATTPTTAAAPTGAAQAADSPLLQALGFDPQSVDALVARTGMDAAALQVALLELELAGHVARLPGGLFQRLGRG
ncbi:DNA-protecting protein DprA [Verminephrobacter aporrectodeae subsp. tuberculatae]|uniref:DNA-protecting protein DprA n=1 Tax=Verminephrobacter aporrectodeae subsp. tuberculatae TaxID=1110392 RepID=A0ABT3KW88_9BURK|nr:DNA-processing protein DprA [Verminephrobacter aporrectodeae]MCW5221928.1 DNA-protecting protein DprA [Verminephrobacter aporrectodeae subsp. tuberculatae]MCW5258252.1 DNA-protecting protein DprA [Verminephrobacter aporrectodeae subsp. tuberculatae]MCW5291219.1 DNA-protecting protein DprA [Verminephrobacter aporrectodeae subsp. tuberculatae]MCW5322617.1 DNA-protecting protein DprA [Verminephrobacter aporrectodeae subsp. tuberculatae]MCW8166096.1 DNA-protecting protein DprA [Verminephrobacte